MVYISLLVTTKQTPILDTQKIKESKHTPTKTKKNKIETRPNSPGESLMQTRDPCRPWRGSLGPEHKAR